VSHAPARRSRWPGHLAAALFIVGLAMIVVAATRFGAFRIPHRPDTVGLGALWIACLLYAASHGVRVIRLAIITGDPRVSLRQIAMVHAITAAASLVTPFKLGEIFRISELGHLLGDVGRSIVIVWVERAFDSAAIMFLILVASLAEPTVLGQIRPLVIVSVAFVAATLALFTIVPEGLGTLSLFIVRRYDGPHAVRVLKGVHWLKRGIDLGPRFIAGKVSVLLVLTFAIWGLELATLWWATPLVVQSLHNLATGLPIFLSSGSLEGLSIEGRAARSPHEFVIEATLLALGSICMLAYAPLRLRSLLPASGLSRAHP
jgi:hypothetical protein